jgi:hypothetical protein
MIDDEQIKNAIKRIALTPDGALLHLSLQRTLMAICPNPLVAGALPRWEGARKFAADLKELMDSSLAEAPNERAGQSTVGRPIVIAAPRGVSVATGIGARRRVPDTAE